MESLGKKHLEKGARLICHVASEFRLGICQARAADSV